MQGKDESRVGGVINIGSGAMLKRKSLSGSAKRRKKMMTAQVGRLVQVNDVKQDSPNSHNDTKNGSGRVEVSNGKVSEKQARSNARRLERKQQAVDALKKC